MSTSLQQICPSSSTSPMDDQLPFMTGVEVKVFQTAMANYHIDDEFTRDDTIALHWAFGGTTFAQVLEMLDEDNVTIMKSASGKVLVQVYGKSGGEVYWVPPGKSVCQCVAFLRGKKDYCKHVLAAHIALAIHTPDEYDEISEQEIVQIFHEKIVK